MFPRFHLDLNNSRKTKGDKWQDDKRKNLEMLWDPGQDHDLAVSVKTNQPKHRGQTRGRSLVSEPLLRMGGCLTSRSVCLCAQACVEKTGRTAPHMEPRDLYVPAEKRVWQDTHHTVSSEIRSAAGIGSDFFPSLYFPIFSMFGIVYRKHSQILKKMLLPVLGERCLHKLSALNL